MGMKKIQDNSFANHILTCLLPHLVITSHTLLTVHSSSTHSAMASILPPSAMASVLPPSATLVSLASRQGRRVAMALINRRLN